MRFLIKIPSRRFTDPISRKIMFAAHFSIILILAAKLGYFASLFYMSVGVTDESVGYLASLFYMSAAVTDKSARTCPLPGSTVGLAGAVTAGNS